jgi:hypothetical protein
VDVPWDIHRFYLCDGCALISPVILIHASHEAGVKVGGIGAVLDGLLSAPAYLSAVSRSIVVGTMNTRNGLEMERLFAPRNRLYVYYFPTGQMQSCPQPLAEALSQIERAFSVRILYGRRGFGPAQHEVLLVDPADADGVRYGQFCYYVWERFGLDSGRHNANPEFHDTMAHAEPAFAALQAVLAHSGASQDTEPATIIAHEWMGLPLWYAAALNAPGRFSSAFVAHEVATVRPIVESDGGHDTRFYSVMRKAAEDGVYLEDVFGAQLWNFKNDMIKTAAQCDHVLAVGDLVIDELRFLSWQYRNRRIDLVYNGTPSKRVSLESVHASGEKLRDYAQALIGARPQFIFSHVTRMVVSKALWRDIRVMEQLDGMLADRGESAVLLMLTSVKPEGRTSGDVRQMESYGWPREHRYGWPDLIDLEASLYGAIQHFNANARASQIVLINQFGFTRDRCGERMPADMGFEDLRHGTDLEFGQSIYEPFGIAQVEPLSTGALCVISDVCGCLGFASAHSHTRDWNLRIADLQNLLPNIVVANYTHTPPGMALYSWRDAMRIGQWERDGMERHVAWQVAGQVIQRLPRTAEQRQKLIDTGYALATQMSWDVVAREQLLPALG